MSSSRYMSPHIPSGRRLLIVILFGVLMLQACAAPLKPWHTVRLDEEFTQARSDEAKDFNAYLALEDRLFRQLDEEIYAKAETGPAYMLDRYSPGSAADPRKHLPNWNRSFELKVEAPRGGVLLLHGMSDSPYSLHSLGLALHRQGYWVLGLRMPGHGTIPSGLRFINSSDMAASVRIAMAHLAERTSGEPLHIMGYSTGATLALEYTLNALEAEAMPVPSSLVLISPAIGIHAAAAMAGVKNSLASVPGLSGKAFLSIKPEFDPYKYNSFATNASTVVHRLTRSVASRIKARAENTPEYVLPPTLVFKSAVDATVTTDAVIDDLLIHLKADRHELVLFDVNRAAKVKARLLTYNPAPLTDRVMADSELPFPVTLVSNEHNETLSVVGKRKPAYSSTITEIKELDMVWPYGVISQSHVSVPFSPDDPLYGQRPPDNEDFMFLGQMAIQGERGLLRIPLDWLYRLRYNPFYDYMEQRVIDWIGPDPIKNTKN